MRTQDETKSSTGDSDTGKAEDEVENVDYEVLDEDEEEDKK
jgi:hypothetical protein